MLYVLALALAPLSLVQATAASGVGILAVMVSRHRKVPLTQLERGGVAFFCGWAHPAWISLAGAHGEVVLQAGFQCGNPLTTAGIATLFTNALPIVAGETIFAEPRPQGWLGIVRVVSFGLVVASAVALSRHQHGAAAQWRPASKRAERHASRRETLSGPRAANPLARSRRGQSRRRSPRAHAGGAVRRGRPRARCGSPVAAASFGAPFPVPRSGRSAE